MNGSGRRTTGLTGSILWSLDKLIVDHSSSGDEVANRRRHASMSFDSEKTETGGAAFAVAARG